MFCLQQDYDLQPASPRTRDAFIELAQNALIPAVERHGGRLVGAFFGNQDWFLRVTHFLEFPDLAAFETWRRDMRNDAAACGAQKQAEVLAPIRNEMLLESLGVVPDDALDKGIDAARETPQGIYTAAQLKVAPGRMDDFEKLLRGAAASLPILTSWRPVAGDPDLVIDLWKGDVERSVSPYAPTTDALNGFMDPLREVAPNERVVRYFALPYSPLA